MNTRRPRPSVKEAVPAPSAPQYELRVRSWGPADEELQIWQVPSPSTPQLTAAVRVAGLRGRNLALIEHRVLRRLSQAGIKLAGDLSVPAVVGVRSYAVTEHVALVLGLLFRTLAPMRSRENILRVTEGIDAMGQEEAAYWLGMAIHRSRPRRVLSALRILLTDPAHSAVEAA